MPIDLKGLIVKIGNTTELEELLTKRIQFVIPKFQRTYGWKMTQWEKLWLDITNLIERRNSSHEADRNFQHYLGFFITQSIDDSNGVTVHETVDGQQRLTTITLLLAALRDHLNFSMLGYSKNHKSPEIVGRRNLVKTIKGYLVNDKYLDSLIKKDTPESKNLFDELRPRIRLMERDRKAYEAIVIKSKKAKTDYSEQPKTRSKSKKSDGLYGINAAHDDVVAFTGNSIETPGVEQCYDFFRQKFANTFIGDNIFDDADALMNALRGMNVAHVELSRDDDVHQIYESINHSGIGLTAPEIIKNGIMFRSANTGELRDKLYTKYWSQFDDKWWSADVGKSQTRFGLFLISYLSVRQPSPVRRAYENLTNDFLAYVDSWTQTIDKSAKNKNAAIYKSFDTHLDDMQKAAKWFKKRYKKFVDAPTLGGQKSVVKEMTETSLSLEKRNWWSILLWLEDNNKALVKAKVRDGVYAVLERWLVLCNLTKTGNNKPQAFVVILNTLNELAQSGFEDIDIRLHEKIEESAEYISIPDITEAKLFVNKGTTNKALVRTVLGLIENNSSGARRGFSSEWKKNGCQPAFKAGKAINVKDLQIEHVLPQKWKQNWGNLPTGISKAERNRNVEQIGNKLFLTPDTNNFVSNDAYEEKKPFYENEVASEITRQFPDLYPQWNDLTIGQRTTSIVEELYDMFDCVDKSRITTMKVEQQRLEKAIADEAEKLNPVKVAKPLHSLSDEELSD